MQRPRRRAEQRAIGRVLDQRVLEQIGGQRRISAAGQQPRLNETVKRRRQRRLVEASHPRQERMGKLAPDRRSDLRHVLGRSQPVEPRHQRSMEAGGNEKRRRGGRRGLGSRRALVLRLQHCPRHLLDEQRYSIGALDNMAADLFRQRPAADDLLDEEARLAGPQPIDRERGHERPPDPRRDELLPERHEQQNPEAIDPFDEPAQRFQARRIGPVGVLEDHQHWTIVRDRLDVAVQRLESFPPPLLRLELGHGKSAVVRQRQHFGQQRDIPGRCGGEGEQGLELVELGLRVVLARKPGQAFQLSDDGMEGAAGMQRRTEIAPPQMRLARHSLRERRGQSRLADARLAGEQHDLTLACLRLGPAPKHEVGFFLAPDQSRETARAQRLEAARPATLPDREIARIGAAMPLISCRPRSPSSKRSPKSLRVLSAMTTLSGSAIP